VVDFMDSISFLLGASGKGKSMQSFAVDARSIVSSHDKTYPSPKEMRRPVGFLSLSFGPSNVPLNSLIIVPRLILLPAKSPLSAFGIVDTEMYVRDGGTFDDISSSLDLDLNVSLTRF